jgi:hypothetical protein
LEIDDWGQARAGPPVTGSALIRQWSNPFNQQSIGNDQIDNLQYTVADPSTPLPWTQGPRGREVLEIPRLLVLVSGGLKPAGYRHSTPA